jgi:uncharacterized membrane protein/mono/diheme cytochrome c family protein
MVGEDLNDWLILIGRTHPLVVHLPIGMLFIAVIFELLSWWRDDDVFTLPLYWIWLAASITSVIACVAGIILADEGGYDDTVVFVHQWLGISVAVVSSILWMLHATNKLRQSLRAGSSLLALLLVSIAGHFGGTLTHGADFLGDPISTAFGIEDETPIPVSPRKPLANPDQAVVYSDLVQPILEQKCVRCHSSRKQKGKLRLDTYADLVKGGKNGNTLVAGNPSGSELYKRLVLPRDDKHRMPPKGKSQLSKSEIKLIHWWIREGKGSEVAKLAEVEKNDSIVAVLASFTGAASADSIIQEIELPEVKVNEVSDSQLVKLREAGLVVNRFASGSSFLTVNCVNASGFDDEQVALLLPLAGNIVWLKAGRTQLTDRGLKNLGALKNLTRLSLENTAITNNGLSVLSNFDHLIYLNLIGTSITDKSMGLISKQKKLKSVYLWQTEVTPAGAALLRQALPAAEVNLGESF